METRPDTRARQWASLATATVLGAAAFYPLWTSDLFGHLAAGRQIAQLGAVPDVDTFSFYFDRPQPWRNHNWFAGLLFWWLYALGGPALLIALKVVLVGALGVLLVLACDRGRLAPWTCALLCLWSVAAVRIRFSVRPHLFGLLACAALLYALRAMALRRPAVNWRTLLGFGALQVAWVNTHGSGPMGLLLTGAYCAGHFGERERRRDYLGVLAAQAVGSCISPWGPAILLESFMHVGSEGTRQFIGEWAPLGLDTDPLGLVSWLVVAMLLAWVAVPLMRSGAAGVSGLLVSVAMLAMAARSMRFIDHALLLTAPTVASGMSMRLAPALERPARAAHAALGMLGLIVQPMLAAQAPPYLSPGGGISHRNLPSAIGRWLAEHRPGARIVALMEDSWYLSFAVPRAKVLIDGRQAVFPLEVLQRVTGALNSPGALQALVHEKDADTIVLRHTRAAHAPAIDALLRDPDFGLAQVSDRHVVFVRRLPAELHIETLRPHLDPTAYAPAARARAWAELKLLDAGAGSAAYVGFQRAVLGLSDDLRNAGQDGLQPTDGEARRRRYLNALRALGPALLPHDNFPTAQVLAGLLQVRLCDLDAAERSLELAQAEGQNRHTVGLALELAVQRGQTARADQMLAALQSDSPTDTWLSALRAEQRSSSRCR